jgi:hypothetical protein
MMKSKTPSITPDRGKDDLPEDTNPKQKTEKSPFAN